MVELLFLFITSSHIGSDLSPLYPSRYKKISLQFPFPWTTGPNMASKLAPQLFPIENLSLINLQCGASDTNAHSLNKKKQKHKTNDGSESHD